MKRRNFETQLEEFGIRMSEYGGECYFGEGEDCSVVLAPYPAESVDKAALAIRAERPQRRKVVIDHFLRAAGVQPSFEMTEALDGREYRGRSGSKNVTIAVFDDEFVVTVAERAPEQSPTDGSLPLESSFA